MRLSEDLSLPGVRLILFQGGGRCGQHHGQLRGAAGPRPSALLSDGAAGPRCAPPVRLHWEERSFLTPHAEMLLAAPCACFLFYFNKASGLSGASSFVFETLMGGALITATRKKEGSRVGKSYWLAFFYSTNIAVFFEIPTFVHSARNRQTLLPSITLQR